MWNYAIGVLKFILCCMVAWGLKDSPMALPVACVCLAIIGVMATQKIYEKG